MRQTLGQRLIYGHPLGEKLLKVIALPLAPWVQMARAHAELDIRRTAFGDTS